MGVLLALIGLSVIGDHTLWGIGLLLVGLLMMADRSGQTSSDIGKVLLLIPVVFVLHSCADALSSAGW
ncbi:hypothetical protein GCM10011352_04810 [Marinobacterium zhoushanense]|uniref:Uncharacterized protein n=1 Tax=Marinobacterium zhoushanense TaxID=1679163 RepID=A0ABQ1K243_9GAMM|nr:hypothetical protein [Marinobacterium zhoushanense]GGB82046.1 hypothetical protein GCM10011352_04810 [Marinobacterium zhoushanense]